VDERTKLQQLLTQVQHLSDQHWGTFTEACRLMDGKAWVGPSAHGFDRELHRDHRALQSALQESVDLIKQKLSHTI
jgi:hypothetical protein